MRLLSLAAFLSIAALCAAQDADSAVGLRTSFPIYKRKALPDTEPISRVPKKFEHPRVFFSRDELPRLRKLLLDEASIGDWEWNNLRENTPVPGAGGFQRLKHLLIGTNWVTRDLAQTPLFKGPYRPFYDDLLKASKTPGAFDVSLEAVQKRYGKDVVVHSANAAENGFGHYGMYGKLSGAAFVALITENEEPFNPKDLGKALGALCRHHRPVWEDTDTREFGFFHDAPMDVGMAYDWLYNDMSKEDITECRELIATMTDGRREFGAQYLDFPWTGINWNWVGWHEHIVVLAASIDGEHPKSNYTRWVDDNVKVQNYWYRIESSEAGLAKEGLGYHLSGINGALPTTAVVARSGENLFEKEETRDALYRMVLYRVYTAAPWIDQYEDVGTESLLDAFSHGDAPNRNRPRASIVLRKYFPTDPLVAWGFKVSDFTVALWEPLMSSLFVTDRKPIGNYSNLEAIAKTVGLPENYFCRERGEMIVRDHWRPDATMFDFEAKMNAASLGHNHADRNSFYLYSRGRAWIVDNKDGDTENIAHQTILIDGVGTGGGATPKGENLFPGMPAKFLEYAEGTNDGVEWVSGVGDAKAAYDYSATCDRGALAEGYECVDSPFKRTDFSYDPAPLLHTPKFPGLTDEWMNDERAKHKIGQMLVRFNPVEKAFRSTLFVKSKKSSGESHPWALIVDDIKKDDKAHKYEFVMNLPWVIEGGAMWQYRHQNERVIRDDAATKALGKEATDMILKDERDPSDSGPRLLVRVVRANDLKPGGLKYYHQRGFNLRKKMGGAKKTTRQVVIETQTTSPDFVVFLYPHYHGDSLPETALVDGGKTLSVKIPDGDTTTWGMSKLESGRTRIKPMKYGGLQTRTQPGTEAPSATSLVTSTIPTSTNSTSESTTTAPESSTMTTTPTTAAATALGAENTTTALPSTASTTTSKPSTEPDSPASTTQSDIVSIGSSQALFTQEASSASTAPRQARLEPTTAPPAISFESTRMLQSTDGPSAGQFITTFTTTPRAEAEDPPTSTDVAPSSNAATVVPNTTASASSRRPATSSSAGAYLAIARSGAAASALGSAERLAGGERICAADYGRAGFTLVCVLPDAARAWVRFAVGGEAARTERYAPYCIAGDSGPGTGNKVHAWVRYPREAGRVQVECASSDGYRVGVQVEFACNGGDGEYRRYYR